MSAHIEPGGVVQLTMNALYNGQRCFNTFKYTVNAAGTPPSATLADFVSWWNNNVFTRAGDPHGLVYMMHESVTDITITAQIVAGPGSRSLLEVFDGLVTTGQYTGGTALPSGASIVLQRVGNMAGPKNRGRIFLYGVPTGWNNLSNVADAAKTEFSFTKQGLELVKTFGAGGNVLQLIPCVTTGNAVPTASQTGLTYYINDSIRYQRRREVGRGI